MSRSRQLAVFLALGALGAAATSDQPAPAPRPRIAMLWSPAANLKEERLANWAKHSVIVVGIEDIGLEWTREPFPAMAETIRSDTIPQARDNLERLRQLNPAAVVLCEVYFFEENDRGYPPDHPWWLRDKNGRKSQFWPGTHQMDLSNPEYVAHIARRIGAIRQAAGAAAGVFLDNLRFEPESKAAWISLLKQARRSCGPDMPILVNAGWDSDDLAWVCPYVNGIMYEDSVAHTADKDTEAFYARIAQSDKQIPSPRISVNERFGKRADLPRMSRELLRTLVYTDMAFLYSDSTNGHKHDWHALWDAPLGRPLGDPVQPQPGQLARREFSGGCVLWLPDAAPQPVTVKLPKPMRDEIGGATTQTLTLKPGSGALLTAAAPSNP